MPSELIAELRVLGFECAPDEITSLLCVEPSSIWVKDGLISKTGKGSAKHQENGWALKAKAALDESSMDFDALFDYLYETISPIKEKFRLLPINVSVHLSCCAYFREGLPGFSMNESFIRLLSEINASVDLDLYDLRI